MNNIEKLDVYVLWIKDAIDKINSYVLNMDYEEFKNNELVIDWCLMQFVHVWETLN
jgi:uncharacterized protein with HEPN domain